MDSTSFLQKVLRPVLGICVENGVLIQEVIENVKECAVDAAKERIENSGRKVTSSAISLQTGLRRAEVNRLHKHGEKKPALESIPTRVVGRWQTDERFLRKSGGPRTLEYDGDGSEFWELVHSVSTDIHPGIVLAELEEAGTVKHSSRGVKLLRSTHNVSSNKSAAYQILARDVGNLIAAVQENVDKKTKTPNLHGTTFFTNIHPDDFDKIRDWVLSEGTEFHNKVRSYISSFHKELSPESEAYNSGITLYLTTFTKSLLPEPANDPAEESKKDS